MSNGGAPLFPLLARPDSLFRKRFTRKSGPLPPGNTRIALTQHNESLGNSTGIGLVQPSGSREACAWQRLDGRLYSVSVMLGMAAVSKAPLPEGLTRMSGAELYMELAGGVFLLAMASVVAWLTVRIGKGLPRRNLFRLTSL